MKPCKRCKERIGHALLGGLCQSCMWEVEAANSGSAKMIPMSDIVSSTSIEDGADVEWLIKEGWKE